jgi:hypothetical protein
MPNISAGTRRDEAIRKLEATDDERYKWLAPFGPVRHADEQERTWGTPGTPADSFAVQGATHLVCQRRDAACKGMRSESRTAAT